jgi:hypothetical protein
MFQHHSVPAAFRCRLAEQRKRRTEKTLQEGALGSAPGEDPKSEQNGQQVASQVVSGLHGGDRAALLSSSDAAAEERKLLSAVRPWSR